MEVQLRATGLTKRFGTRTVLHGLDLTLSGPQIIGILGPNGAGKTTLLEVLEGLTQPELGTLELFGSQCTPASYPRSRVGVVLQREAVPEGFRVEDYVALFASIHGRPDALEETLRKAQLTAQRKQSVAALSGGEAQRLFLQTAVLHQPKLLFLDEPTAHLDPASRRELGAAIRQLGQVCTVVLSTHELREAQTLCDEWLFLVDGRIRAQGPRDRLLAALDPPPLDPNAAAEAAFFHYCGLRIDTRGETQ